MFCFVLFCFSCFGILVFFKFFLNLFILSLFLVYFSPSGILLKFNSSTHFSQYK